MRILFFWGMGLWVAFSSVVYGDCSCQDKPVVYIFERSNQPVEEALLVGRLWKQALNHRLFFAEEAVVFDADMVQQGILENEPLWAGSEDALALMGQHAFDALRLYTISNNQQGLLRKLLAFVVSAEGSCGQREYLAGQLAFEAMLKELLTQPMDAFFDYIQHSQAHRELIEQPFFNAILVKRKWIIQQARDSKGMLSLNVAQAGVADLLKQLGDHSLEANIDFLILFGQAMIAYLSTMNTPVDETVEAINTFIIGAPRPGSTLSWLIAHTFSVLRAQGVASNLVTMYAIAKQRGVPLVGVYASAQAGRIKVLLEARGFAVASGPQELEALFRALGAVGCDG
ncbi:MAG: hypothetical protein B7X06_00550 [Verrucomicrobia bacterium 21-51-4]|nr:MAG: hypothetical protein B7X06_00550 [Verrucomicrobia bacterium 21-51-4]HQU09274.1 hypothetical protein [Opitutales bacterium]